MIVDVPSVDLSVFLNPQSSTRVFHRMRPAKEYFDMFKDKLLIKEIWQKEDSKGVT